jgi:hypothetical protein
MQSIMKSVNMIRGVYFLSVLLLFTACNKKTKENILLEPITLSAEGPYFEGPNSFQGKIGLDVTKFLKEKGYNNDQLKDIKIVRATVMLDSSSVNIQDLTLQVVSEKESMKKLAFINPLTPGSKKIDLSVAEEQKELAQYFLEEGTLVLDANFLKDLEQNVSFTVSLELELTINH